MTMTETSYDSLLQNIQEHIHAFFERTTANASHSTENTFLRINASLCGHDSIGTTHSVFEEAVIVCPISRSLTWTWKFDGFWNEVSIRR